MTTSGDIVALSNELANMYELEVNLNTQSHTWYVLIRYYATLLTYKAALLMRTRPSLEVAT
jgi:hypothetical protein